ncbi:hypothetical protein PR003_g14066 [Phytophthora rubi]|uniref:Uncharacterized protein n=1 Tax=Phytophthora rubi TaxID=129364 RepID=A0A6A3M0L5_9STRA|nr:hypothetical protein PR001_g12782 [Phytophthora rubi]KAE9333351.1 hypothetical protein PR003_g14066 [Phytophthora rubi]
MASKRAPVSVTEMLSSGFKTRRWCVSACCAAFLSRSILVRVQRLDSLLKKKTSTPLSND